MIGTVRKVGSEKQIFWRHNMKEKSRCVLGTTRIMGVGGRRCWRASEQIRMWRGRGG